jgi:polysaccharide biosynthesis protein PslJ
MDTAIRVPTVRRPALPAGWPIYAVILGLPLWWILGIAAFVWPVFAVPMLFWLLRRGTVVVPRGFLVWVAFLGWALASSTQLVGTGRTISYVWRTSLYLSATIFLLYVFNLSRERLPARRLAMLLAAFWGIVVAGGYLAVLAPTFSVTSLAERMLPESLRNDAFLQTIVHPAAAQIHDFLGYAVARPAAPFTYTNDWGSTFGLLIPFVILAWNSRPSPGVRSLLAVLAVASVVPVVFSLNRGLWLSLAIGLLYAAVRLALAGRERAVVALIGVVLVVGSLLILTPLKDLIDARLQIGHSNERRAMLYEEAGRSALESPLLGYGAPLPSKWNPNAPPVGTQGLLWTVLVSHGFVGAALFVAWFLYALWRTRSVRNDVRFWCHVMLLIAIIQLAVYDMLPTQLHIMMIGIAMAMRETSSAAETPARELVNAGHQ